MAENHDTAELKAFGLHLKILRIKKALSQEMVANQSDISLSTLSRMERGLYNPSLSVLIRIARTLNIQKSELLMYEDPN